MNLSWKIFSAFGIPVRLHFSMIIIPFIAFRWVPGDGPASMVTAAVLTVLLFSSVLAHELGHALTGRRYGVHTADIILTPLGGMARMLNIPTSPKQEIAISIAGPLVSFGISAISFLLILNASFFPFMPKIGLWALDNLFFLNLMLGAFNLIPALPMDGGRVFRGLLALKYGHFKATQIASRTGKILAVVGALYGFTTGWWSLALISVFIYMSAGQEERIAYAREAAKQGGGSPFPGFGFTFRRGGPGPMPGGGRPRQQQPGPAQDTWQTPESDWSAPRPRHQGNGPQVKVVEGGKVEVISRKTPDKH